MQRVNQLNLQFAGAAAKKPQRARPLPHDDVIVNLGFDKHMSTKGNEFRKQLRTFLSSHRKELNEHVQTSEFPLFMLEGLRKINAGGFSRIPEKYGGNGLSFKDMMIMTIEIMKHDGSFGIFMGVQEALGNSTIYETGNEEQKERFLTQTTQYKQINCFGLTEPNYGSDATSLRTNAVKVEGGYKINGQKRWIGNGTWADNIIVWAKNKDDKNKI